MADHVRKRVRDAAKTLLSGASIEVGPNVFTSRVDPLQDAELPAIKLTTPEETSTILAHGVMSGKRKVERTLMLKAEICVKQVSGYEDTADEIAKDVEIAIAGDNTLGGLCKHIQLTGTVTELAGEGERPIARTTLSFEVYYITALDAPDTPD